MNHKHSPIDKTTREGHTAYGEGKRIEDNPYLSMGPKFQSLAEKWENGWLGAETLAQVKQNLSANTKRSNP